MLTKHFLEGEVSLRVEIFLCHSSSIFLQIYTLFPKQGKEKDKLSTFFRYFGIAPQGLSAVPFFLLRLFTVRIILKHIFKPQCRSAFLIALLFVPFVSYSRPQKNGRNMGGTWEELGRHNPHVRTGFFVKRCPSPIYFPSLITFRFHRQGCFGQ